MVSIVGTVLGNPDSVYLPSTITVHVGQTVTWIDKDNLEHTVTPDQNYPGWSGGSRLLHHRQKYSFTFTHVGVYRYHCMVHPNMLGVVKVVAAKGSSS